MKLTRKTPALGVLLILAGISALPAQSQGPGVATHTYFGLNESEINNYFAKIDSMTTADAQRVIRQHFPLDSLVFVLVGKAEEIRSLTKKYASKVDIKSIEQPGF